MLNYTKGVDIMINYREKRTKLNLTQSDIAREVGVSLMTYQLWERGVMNPTKENEEKLLKALKCIK